MDFNWASTTFLDLCERIGSFSLRSDINLFKFKPLKAISLDQNVIKLACLVASNILCSDVYYRCFRKSYPTVEVNQLQSILREGFLIDVMRVSHDNDA